MRSRLRIGLTWKIALITGALLMGLAGTVLLVALRQQEDLIMDYSLQEIQGKLDPVERKTEQIRFYGATLETLQEIKPYYIDKSESEDATDRWRNFDREQLEQIQTRLKASLSARGEGMGDAEFNQIMNLASYVQKAREQTRKARGGEVEAILQGYTQVGRALDWKILQHTGYRETLRSTFEGLESRYRIQTVGLFFQAYFDTSLLSPARDIDFDIQEIQRQLYQDGMEPDRRAALYETLQGLLQRRNRLNRLGNPEINLLQPGTNQEIRATLDSVRNAYYSKKPATDIHHHTYSTEENEYLISTRTLFMKPEISERARIILSTGDAADSQIWARYLGAEEKINQRLKGIIEQLRAIRNADGSEKPYALLRNTDFQTLYREYENVRNEKQTALEEAMMASTALDRQTLEGLEEKKADTAEAIEQSQKRMKELQSKIQSLKEKRANAPEAQAQTEESNGSENSGNAEAEAEADPLLELEQQLEDEARNLQALKQRLPQIETQIKEFFPRSRRIGDAYWHLSDAMLMDDAIMEFVYDPTTYFSYEGSRLNRDTRQKKWEAMRSWIRTACAEVSSCGNVYLPYLAGNGQWVRPRRVLEDIMWKYDTMPSTELAQNALFENTAAFTRIFSDRSGIDRALLSERHRLLDMALSIGLRMVLVALLISLFFVRRIKNIIGGVEQVGAGNLKTVFHYPGNDELGTLASTLNQMTRDLRHRQSMIQEISAAEQIQNQLLPSELPANFTDYLGFGFLYRASSGVGGDYFDFIEIDERRLAFCIADVTGHGPGPAMIMAMMRSHLHSLIQLGKSSPGEILQSLNDRLYSETPSHVFITMLLGVYDKESHQIHYGSAGHNRGLMFRYEGETVETLPAGGLPLGLEDRETFSMVLEVHSTTLNPGDMFFQYTDGINEATNASGTQFGTTRIEKILAATGKKKTDTVLRSMVSNLESFTGKKVMKDGPTELADDIAMIVFRRIK
ncbi:MAG: SpoIIE family protein phosphatase [Leptospiraceae bacterium]|nr:SpoIIE family protein phosphatase [Leptospiraceae bacterium]